MLPKTTTPVARAGNPPPRVAETPAGMVNSIGLQNPGVESFLQNLDAFDLGVPSSSPWPAIPSPSSPPSANGSRGDDRISAVELNLSCPNVECGGLMFCAGAGLRRGGGSRLPRGASK